MKLEQQQQQIGFLKTSTTVYCSVCDSPLKRRVKVPIFSMDKEHIDTAKNELIVKLGKEYTCKICKSISQSV